MIYKVRCELYNYATGRIGYATRAMRKPQNTKRGQYRDA